MLLSEPLFRYINDWTSPGLPGLEGWGQKEVSASAPARVSAPASVNLPLNSPRYDYFSFDHLLDIDIEIDR